jgi:nucleotide-binding universal stress UspA family protein
MTRTISRILVATDFSTGSDLALDYATTLAHQFGAAVHLLHVVEDPFVAGAWTPELYIASISTVRASLIDEAAARLARLCPAFERHGLTVTSEVMVGSPAPAIRDVAEARRCDLVVMGTHGRSGMAHLLLGSVAEKVIRQAPCPVLTVRAQAAPALAGEPELFARDYVPAE